LQALFEGNDQTLKAGTTPYHYDSLHLHPHLAVTSI
jgi:hypothetical protein